MAMRRFSWENFTPPAPQMSSEQRRAASVAAVAHARIFYTGTIGSSALAPVLFGRVGDTLGAWHALELVAAFVLLTLPLAALLRGSLSRR